MLTCAVSRRSVSPNEVGQSDREQKRTEKGPPAAALFPFGASACHLCVSSIFRPDFRCAAMLKRAKPIEDFAMTMTRFSLACALALGLTTGAALAQDTTAPAAPATPAEPATPAAPAAPAAADDGQT